MRKKGNLFWKIGAGVLIIISIMLAAVIQPASAEESAEDEIILNFSFTEPIITEVNVSNTTFHTVTMNDTKTFNLQNLPVLPAKPLKVLLSQKAILESIDIALDGSTSLGDGYNILLGDGSIPGQNQTNMTYFNPAFPYPSEIISNTEIFEFKGYSILVFNLFPVHYISQNGSLYYYEDMTVTIKTNTTGSVSPYFRNKMEDESLMKQFVDDYTMNHTYTDIPSPPEDSSIVNSSEDYDFVIITRKAYTIKPFLPPSIRCWRTFWDLAEYKNSQDIRTKIVTIKDILKEPKYHYDGKYGDNDSFFNDTQCHIRNFIRHAYSAWNISYVLLGGDNSSIIGNEIVPARNLWFKYADMPYVYDSTLPSDFYYACLNGDFNYDKNEYWGEPWDGGPGGDLIEPAVHEGEKYAEINSEYGDTSFATGLFTPSLNLSDSNSSLKFYTAHRVSFFSNVSIYSGGANASDSNFEETIWSNGGLGEINIPIDASNYSDPSCVYIQFNYTHNYSRGTFNIDNVSVSKNTSIILWEKFEGNEFPPEGWTIVQYEGNGTWIQEYYRIDVDLYPEVFIGRAPVGNIKEVSNFVRKTLKYEQTPNYDPVIAKALMVAGRLDAKTYGGDCKDEIINFSNGDYFTYGIPEDNYTIDTLYDRDELYRVENDTFHYWPRENFTKKINDGVHLMNKDGHGYNDMIVRHFYGDEDKLKEDRGKWGSIRFYNLHTYLLKNKIPFFMYAQSCLVGAFDNYYYDWRNFTIPILNIPINISPGVHHGGLFDCLGEYLTVKSIHGAFAVIMNARHGFYNPGGTDSVSQRLDRYFFNATFGDFINTGDPSDIRTLGEAHHEAKLEILNELVNDYSAFQRWRHVSYGLNLLGDPTVSLKVPEEGNSPNKPATPKIESKLGNFYEFSTNTTHPNDDRVSYKFKWDNHECFLWTKFYDSGETATKIIILPSGFHNISVKARDIYRLESEWSDLLPISVSFDSDISIDSSLTVLGEETQFYGQTSAEPYTTWYYDLDDGNNSEQQNATHTYNTLGTYNVTLTVTDDQNISSNVTRVVNVVLLKADFDSSNYGISNETIYFNDTSDGYHTIINWSWDFGDSNISYDQNTSHQYAIEGVYNVSLTVTDNESNTNVFYQTIYIDSGIPEITSVSNNFDIVGYGSDVTFTANLTDSISGVKTVKVNVTYPDNAYGNFTMSSINGNTYEYVFNDTGQLGDYSYYIWVVDNADNSICSSEYDFIVYRCFGYNMIGDSNQSIWDTITGSRFTVYEKSVADNITVYLDPGNATSDLHYQCMIYRHNDSKLIGITEEKNISGGKGWQTFNFSVPKPVLMDECVLGCWADNYTIHMYYDDGVGEEMFYDDGTSTLQGHYFEGVYNYAPDINNFDHEDRKYSIYCRYSPDNTSPDITNVSDTPNTVGFGFNVTIAADVTDNASGIETVKVNITYPDSSTGNFTMTNTGNSAYEYVFDTWLVGQYDYIIWTVDYAGNSNSSTGYSFSVSAEATISVCTIKDEYGDNAINLTDPPGDPPLIGYELLDGGKVLHIWNRYDSYYFNTSSGIQLTNHYEEYWSHNVLMLGYYNNDEWNLIYRADELSGFNKNIDSDNENYVNVTLWKDLTYSGYSFRLAIRYHLGVDYDELTVIPYIKNLGDAIPYVLGFAWEINDIQVDMTPEGDYIEINGTSFYLNETIDVRFTNMTAPVYCWNETMNETYVCGYEPIPYFYVKENLSGNRYESLYLRWDDSLEYMVQVESRDGEYNAPVTLAFKVGILDVGQEKYTELLWHDASEVIYYFNSYNEEKIWDHQPEWMIDGDSGTPAETETQGSVEWLDENDCPGTDIGAISKVEIRASGFYDWGADDNDIILTPLFEGYKDGNKHIFDCGLMPPCHWSNWFDITTDENAPEIWTWNDISNLDCLVEADSDSEEFKLYCSKVEIRVIFIENTAEEVYFFIDEFESDWEYPEYMVDGDYGAFAYTGKDGFEQHCSINTCEEEDLGAISKVELRACGYREEVPANISLTPVFGGENDGSEYIFVALESELAWSEWFDITDDAHAPETWSWIDVKYLDCRMRALGGEGFVLFCSKIDIRVSYTPPNNAPEISNPYPVDGSSGISISPTLGITVSDGDTMDITWYRNSSGSWVAFGSNSTVGSGTYHQIFADASVNGQWWYWKVNVTDGKDYTESSVYRFYTGYQSKIKNTGSTDIRGYLLMQVHFFDEMLGEWVVADDTVNETSPRTINAGQQLGLDAIFNGLVNTNDLSEYGSGTYRVYAAFRDPDENILKCDDETEMLATYEFNITLN